jgi:hypothetical protein
MTSRTLIFPIVSACVAFTSILVLPALADDPPVYYVSMRALTAESAASFVTVSREQTAERTTAIAGCDELTYYASASDAQSVATARANGELVQLHRGLQGQAPQTSAIICIIDDAG